MAAASGTELCLPAVLRLRRVTAADLPLLERIYGGTRMEELAQTDWDDSQKAAFVHFQFQAQHQHYTTHYTEAEFFVIEHGGNPVGRLYLHWRRGELRIVDIALLPTARDAGTGSTLLQAVLDLARVRGMSVSIHVEKMNRAMALYRRLGFRKVGEHGVYDLMQWHPDAS